MTYEQYMYMLIERGEEYLFLTKEEYYEMLEELKYG